MLQKITSPEGTKPNEGTKTNRLLKRETYKDVYHQKVKPQLHDLIVVSKLFYNRKNFSSFYETADEVRLDLTNYHAMTQKKWGIAVLFVSALVILAAWSTYGMYRLYIFMDKGMEWFLAAVVTAVVWIIAVGWFLYLFKKLKAGLEDYTRDQILQGRYNRPLPTGPQPLELSNKVVMASSTDDDENGQPDIDFNALKMNFASPKFGAGADHKEPWFGN